MQRLEVKTYRNPSRFSLTSLEESVKETKVDLEGLELRVEDTEQKIEETDAKVAEIVSELD